jgi:ATP-dependent helicase/nuclease subunit A
MTRAQQALIVSGSGKGEDKEEKKKAPSWYDRIAAAVIPAEAGIQMIEQASRSETNPLCCPLRGDIESLDSGLRRNDGGSKIELPAILPTGKRAARNSAQQQRGIWLHALLQHLTEGVTDEAELQQRLNITSIEIESLWQQAQHLRTLPNLARFFDAQQYQHATNEMPYINAKGELKRIDRLVEFDNEVWVLDYKLGDSEDAARYRAQMLEYRGAMQSVYAGKPVRCALIFADGVLREIS